MANADIPQIFDQSMNRLCFLDKAMNIGYRQVYNGLWTATFTLPADDIKNQYCQPFNFVEIYDGKKRVELFRIIPSTLSRSTNGYVTYECEHVVATLIDNVLFKYHQVGNIGVYTTQVLRYVLDSQKTKHWQLGRCDFNRQFEYKWENENLLSALFSIPKPFTEAYHWTYDTSTYPWIINLVNAETNAGCEIRYRKNLQSIEKNVDPTNLVTRIYPLGYGEGDNQLTIESVNNGIPYIESDNITTYGLKETIWTDTRFEEPTSLLETARNMLNQLKTPFVSYSVSSIDLFKKTSQSFDEFREGKVVRVIDGEDNIDFNANIVEVEKPDVTKADINITIANKTKDVGGSIADLQERARINDTYAQGATNQMMVNYADNADLNNPAVLKLYIPDTMVRINKCVLNFELEAFRGYTKAVSAAQQSVQSTTVASQQTQSTTVASQQTQTTTSGGGTSTTTQSANINVTSTQSGGGSTETTTSDSTSNVWNIGGSYSIPEVMQYVKVGNEYHSHGVVPHKHDHKHKVTLNSHSHGISIPSHNHQFTINSHSHDLIIPSHGHSVTIPSHQHTVTIPEHTHSMEFGIYRGTTASKISIKIDGKTIPETSKDIDITKYLSVDNSGKIQRNTWHKIEIVPDKLTRITANVFMQIFTNSRGGGDF